MKDTQNTDVLALLKRRGQNGVTAQDAVYALGVYRLAARIFDLRKDGHVIRTIRQPTYNGASIARYVLEV